MSKYKVTVWQSSGGAVHPVIEANSSSEAIRIAKAQYPNAKSIGSAVLDRASTNRFKVTVWLRKGGAIHPIIEAANSSDALRLAKAQYPDAKNVGPASRA